MLHLNQNKNKKDFIMKYIVLIAALCASVSLDAFLVTRKLCKEIPKVIPAALKDIAQVFEREMKARDLTVEAKILIYNGTNMGDIVEESTKLRVDLLPALIVASAQTRSVLSKYSGIVGVWGKYYNEEEKPEEYIAEFAEYAFGGVISGKYFAYDSDYNAYKEFLKHLSKNPDLLKVTQLK